MRKQYSTVKIPVELSVKLDEYVERLGYRSRAEIVNDAIRRFIDSRMQIEEVSAPVESKKITREVTAPSTPSIFGR